MKSAFLILEEGLLKRSLFKLHGTMTIGRGPTNPIHLPDTGVSRVHARIVYDGTTCTLEDLKSTNGTFVEGQRIEGPVVLTNGMTIQIGSARLYYRVQDDEEGKGLSRLTETQEILSGREGKETAAGVRSRPRSRRLEEAIARIPIFQGISETERQELAALANLHVRNAGEIVLREGDPARSLYIVLDGQVRVFTTDYRGNRIVLETFGHDQVFGEIGLITGAPRTASVVSTQESLLAEIPYQRMKQLFDHHPHVREVFEEYSRKHLVDLAQKKAKAGAVERRLHPRLNAELPVKFALLPAEGIEEGLLEEVFRAVSSDISLSGIRLQLDGQELLNVPLETRIRMEIKLEDAYGSIHVLGSIKSRFYKKETNVTLLGIQFHKVSETGMARLKAFIFG